MARRESRTAELLGSLAGNRLVLDELGLLHWYAPRSPSDSRPWTNSHRTRPLSRTLRAVPGPTWPEMYRLVHRLGALPRRSAPDLVDNGIGGWAGSSPDGHWGFRAQTWRFSSDPASRVRCTVWMAHLQVDPEGKETVSRLHLRDTTPAETLYWAARIGIVYNVRVRFRNGTVVRTGDREVRL